ncbi:MAG: lactonase family protein [Chloroflexi bacterium]|nr:lactonase family protein [Chloroflexota bacterium]
MATPKSKGYYVFVGTYSRNGSEGVYVYRMEPSTGSLAPLGVGKVGDNPSFLAIHPSGRFVYAVNEVTQFQGQEGGGVTAFALDPASGALTLLNQQSSVGTDPCHIQIEATGKYALVANYTSGSVAMFPIGSDGCLGPACDFHQHQGSSLDPRRQAGPHAHSINIDPGNRFACAPDLGMDKIVIYRLDLANGKLVPNEAQPFVTLPAGVGPRHFAYHPNGRFAYAIMEIGDTVTVFAYDGERGTLDERQVIGTLPADFRGTSYTADIHVHPNGRFLYGSNRGHDSIAVFAVDANTGRLRAVGHESTQGRFPRNFALDLSGSYLYAANQNSDNVVIYRIDQTTGMPVPTGEQVKVPVPVCVKMLPIP